jgi:hypothetical protein
MNLNTKFTAKIAFCGFGLVLVFLFLVSFKIRVLTRSEGDLIKNVGQVKSAEEFAVPQNEVVSLPVPKLDVVAYEKKLNEIANNPVPATTTSSTLPTLWPVKSVYPNAGALLPFNRIVAYYGNLYSKNMGILGEYSEDEVLARLNGEVKKWETADPTTPVIPALHYIAVVAQAGSGKDGKYRARMPSAEIDKVLQMAEKSNAIVFLDIQVGLSDVQSEVPLLEKYLKLPQVHLGIDPEFSMKTGTPPGRAIGTLDAEDVNFAANYLAKIVRENNLPPKVLAIHRFTEKMVTSYKNIKPLPEVQIVMDMDGFGGQASKLNTYKQFIYKQPVQFTGFKLFYKNDVARGGMLTPNDLLKLTPIPLYIQYQ